MIIFFSVEVVLMHLTEAYLRYLPFSKEILPKQKNKLLKFLLILAIIDFLFSIFLLRDGINYLNYKIFFLLGWIPYLIVQLKIICGKIFQNIYVFGMGGLFIFSIHSISSMIIILIFGEMSAERLIFLGIIYLIIFTIFLPIERKIFINILPDKMFFEDKNFSWIISIFPLVIFLGTVAPMVKVTFLATWQERFSRLIIPLFFFTIYRLINIETKIFEENERRKKIAKLAKQQILTLGEQNLLLQKNRKEVEELRKNLNENYTILDEYLSAEKIEKAIEYIKIQEKLLEKTSVKKYSDSPMINAAISIYLRRAEKIGAKITQKINLPENFSTAENDFAVLISNLLENAVQASERQQKNRREISIIFQHRDEQCVLEISNRYDFEIKLGENELPCTENFGHGIGMTSLKNFAEKYDAYVDFSHKNNLAKFSLYWEQKNYL